MKNLFLLLLPFTSFSQELSYTNYDMKDGLAGSTVYSIVQDKDGFLWFGTETGVSRFDGTHFRNFTSADGLPDNEVLQLYADSKGRIWMAPFKKAVCYYYRGKIYNQENDPILAQLTVMENILHFAEDAAGNILIQQPGRLHIVKQEGAPLTIHTINEQPVVKSIAVTVNPAGNFIILSKDSLYEWKKDRFRAISPIPFKKQFPHPLWIDLFRDQLAYQYKGTAVVQHLVSHKQLVIPSPSAFLKNAFINDSLFYMSSQLGVELYNLNDTTQHTYYLRDKLVASVIQDREGSLWFATLGEGVFRLNSETVKNVQLTKGQNRLGIFSIAALRGKILAGGAMLTAYEMAVDDQGIHITREGSLQGQPHIGNVGMIKVLSNGDLIYGTNIGLCKLSPDYVEKQWQCHISVKGGVVVNENELVLAGSSNVVLFNTATFRITDTLWHDRASAVFFRNDTFFVGTPNGLYLLKKGASPQYWGVTIPPFRNRISAMHESEDGTLWIATSKDGVLGYKDGRITRHLTTQTGLTSNTARCLSSDSCYLWIGTDKGLNKVDIHQSNFPVKKYTTADGLASDVIHAVHVNGNRVYIGTTNGLTYFDESKIASYSRCDLRITGITVADEIYPADTLDFEIPAANNSIRVDFAGISYRSAGDIQYWYRLSGLDSSWRTTRETFLNYPTLPSGAYKLQVQAVNKFGIASALITVPFTVEKILWKKSWFQLSVAGIILLMLWLWTNYRIGQVRDEEAEKLVINKRINELEQLALKAQMNPHFIFNSLNSIQHYVMDKDIEGANKFISSFSKLIRQTLHFS